MNTDSRTWTRVSWWWRGHPEQLPTKIRVGDSAITIEGRSVVQSYRDIYNQYAEHPEVKAAAADGAPCRADTRGLLQPRQITTGDVLRIGKKQ